MQKVARVSLERATIGRVQIKESLPEALDLSYVKVGHWDLPPEDRSESVWKDSIWATWPSCFSIGLLPLRWSSEQKAAEESEEENPAYIANWYKELLHRSHPFCKSNYVAIENARQDDGEDEQADEVHILMRQRDRLNIQGFWALVWDKFLDCSIRYGTTSKRLVCIMILWGLVSIVIFRYPCNVEYKTVRLSPSSISDLAFSNPKVVKHANDSSFQEAPPVDSTDWSLCDAALLAVRFHIPIISLGVDEDVQPRRNLWKAYAMVVVAAHWLMWPLPIASVSGFIRKRN